MNAYHKKFRLFLLIFGLSALASFLFAQGAPVPVEVTAKAGEKAILLEWKKPAGVEQQIVGYNVYRSTDSRKFRKITKKSVTAASYRDKKVNEGRKYFYFVKAIDNQNNLSSPSAIVSAEVLPVSKSGLILMPTAYRNGMSQGAGANLDIVSTYYIGRLYGYHDFPEKTSTNKTGKDFLSRVGIWIFTFDPKLVLQEETPFTPSLAMGYQVSYLMRDTKSPSASSTDVELVSLKKSSSKTLLGFYLAASKNIGPLTLHGGYLKGNVGNMVSYLSEYLPAVSEEQNIIPNMYYAAGELDFFSLMSVKLEFVKPNNLELNPWIINTHLGKFLHFSFDVAYLHYRGGYDWLGFFNFRINVFPWKKGQ
ncbi:MAG: fibronectin type III domain-containing protein [Elusimicrobiota bacterium]